MILLLVLAIVSPGAAQRVRFSNERLSQGEGCRASLADSGKPGEAKVVLSYELEDGGWANLSALLRRDPDARPVTFLFKTSVDCTLELKFIEADGATFGQRVKVDPADGGWRQLTIYPRDAEFWWGGDGTREKSVSFDLAVSGTSGEGKLTLSQARIGKAGEPSSFGPPTSAASDDTIPPASGETPLDLYTWRVFSLDGQQAELLDIPDFDLRYRKRVAFRDRTVVGPYSAPTEAQNIWLEGAAHMACAYAAAGDSARANFYANQLDAALIDQQLGGKATRSLPYTVNQSGDYGWVNPDEGFTSTAAWYVLAKQRFNPLRLKTAQEVHSD